MEKVNIYRRKVKKVKKVYNNVTIKNCVYNVGSKVVQVADIIDIKSIKEAVYLLAS